MSMTFADEDRVAVEIALPTELLDELDEYRDSHGYTSRSEVVSDALSQ